MGLVMTNCCEKSLSEMLTMVEFLNDHYETLCRLARRDNGVSGLVDPVNTSLELLVKGVYAEIAQTYNRIIASRTSCSLDEEKGGTDEGKAR